MNSYGDMKQGNGKQGCNEKFYTSLSENQFPHAWRMSIINKVDKGEEEVECDHLKNDLIAEINTYRSETNQ